METFMQDIEAEVEDAVVPMFEQDNPSPTVRHILSLLHLDFRSEASNLSGLDMDQLRQMYMDFVGGEPVNLHKPTHRVFLLADAEVLSEVSTTKRWLKCVQPHYVATDHVPRHTRMGGQRYFGWFKMTTRSVVNLWEWLGMWDVCDIAPPSIAGAQLETCK